MKGRRSYGVLAGIMLAAVLAGCGDGSEENSRNHSMTTSEPEIVIMTPVPAEPEVQEPGLFYHTGNLTEDEESVIFENMKTLQRNLELPEYVGEGISMVSSEEWFEAMAPRLYEGSRSYFLKKGEEVLLTVLVAYNMAGEPYSCVFCQGLDDTVILLRQEGSTIQLIQVQVSEEGQYDGSFELWQIDSATGEIRSERGTYVKGVIVGDYTVSVCSAPPGAAFDLWTNRAGFAYEIHTVTYDEEGMIVPTATPEPTVAPTSQPVATQRPTATQAPRTPAPTQEPEPPAQDDGWDDSEDDWGDDSGEETNSGNGGQDTNNSDSGSTSGDVDIEWSEDIL